MKLIRTPDGQWAFHLSKREKSLLFDLLRLYPLIPDSYARVRRNDGRQDIGVEAQLLNEALAEQRRENRKQVLALLEEPGRVVQVANGVHIHLTPGQTEWLLQVLNDVRVGSWLAIGSPDEPQGRAAKVDAKNVHLLLALELCGVFQMTILNALLGED